MMLRDLDTLARQRWDVLVIGGGIHGLFAAYDAAQRGLSVALVEAADFGSGLSFNHQRTLHGGLRALQNGQIRKTRQQINERRTWARIAPHFVRPLPFLIGTYARTSRSRSALRLGFALYDFVGRKRNAGVPVELHLPGARLESAATTRKLFPGISEAGLTGGAIWYDFQMRHPDRLTSLVAMAADRAGATLVNYARAVGPRRTGAARVSGAIIRDELTGSECAVAATVTLIAAGAGLGDLLRSFGGGEAPPLLRAMNLLLDRPARDIALAAPGLSGRMLTAVPWAGFVLVGTHQSDDFVPAPETAPPAEAVDRFFQEVNAAFPRLHVSRPDIRLVHHGLTPATRRRGQAELLPEPQITRHAAGGVPGVISAVGVKYTTARWAAERAVDAACEELGRERGHCRTAETLLPHASIADVEGRLVEAQRELALDLDAEIAAHLASWYGSEAPDVLRHSAKDNAVDRLDASTPVLAGEITYAVRHLAAVRLSDVVLRRTSLGSAGHPGPRALARAAEMMAGLLAWTPERQVGELADVENRYPAPTAR
jgi:glycerol-3-phosphate dehydrogenase